MIDIGTLISVSGWILALLGFMYTRRRENKTDDQQEASTLAVLLTKVDNINETVARIEKNFDNHGAEIKDLQLKVTKLMTWREEVDKRWESIGK